MTLEGKSLGQVEWGSVAISAVAGATGVGVAAKVTKLATVAKLGSKATTAAEVGSELVVDGAFSVAQQIQEDGTATVKDTLLDVAGGQALGVPAAKVGKATGEAVSEVGRLVKSAARDDRIANNATREGRKRIKGLEADGKRQQAEDIVTRRAAAASITASELGSKTFENPEEEK